MTAPALAIGNEIRLPSPLPHQEIVLEHPARFKVWRAGRRTGKSRAAVIAAVAGHGPDRCHRGVMQGGDIVWLSPDYPQSAAIWREEIEPRFAGLAIADINRTSKRVEVPGLGSLELRSAEAVDGIRGRKLQGVGVDEAAFQDLEYAWGAVIRPALADNQGWALFISTPNGGGDGNSLKRVPSYFNILCEKIIRGELGAPDWAHFHNRTGDNLRIARDEIASLYAEYPEGSPIVQQELDALLIVGGAGVAFREWDDAVHVVASRQPPRGSRLVVGLDWGFRKGIALTARIGTEGDVEIVHEIEFSKINADDAAKAFGERWDRAALKPEVILYDEQMDQSTSHAQKGNTTLKEQFMAGLLRHYGTWEHMPPMVAAPHAPGSRKVKYDLTHKFLRFKRDQNGDIPAWFRPRLTVQERCRYLIRTLPALQVDAGKPEDDVDIDSPEDHAYDALGFILMSRVFDIGVDEDDQRQQNPDKHPGFDKRSRGRKLSATDMPERDGRLDEGVVEWRPEWQYPRTETLVELED